jgi:hypothetical protein
VVPEQRRHSGVETHGHRTWSSTTVSGKDNVDIAIVSGLVSSGLRKDSASSQFGRLAW